MLKFVPDKRNRIAFNSVKNMRKNVMKGIQSAFNDVKKELKPWTVDNMKKKKHGNTYWVYIGRGGRVLKHGKWHVASAPGETPAILTGALAKSLGYRQRYGKGLTYGANTPYARRHELKKNRTYLKRSIRENDRKIHQAMCRCIKKAIEGRKKK